MKSIGEQIDYCMADMVERLKQHEHDNPYIEYMTTHDFCVWFWPQVWGSTAGPFGGIGGCAMTPFSCCVIACPTVTRDVYVYHGGMFCYRAEMNDAVVEAIKHQRMPGPKEGWRTKLAQNKNHEVE